MRKSFVVVVMLLALALVGVDAVRAEDSAKGQAPAICQQPTTVVPADGTAPSDLIGQPSPEPKIRCLPPSCSSDWYCQMNGLGYECVMPFNACPYCL